jgi:hypothetical protein
MDVPDTFHPYLEIPHLDTPRYILGDVAAAADVSAVTLKMWFSREPLVVPLGPYDRPGRKGVPRLFTLRRVYATAITSELVSIGFRAAKAGRLAFSFTDLATDGPEPLVKKERLVERERPVFLAANARHNIYTYVESPELVFDSELEGPWPRRLPPLSFAIVDCASLMERVRGRLKKRGAL